MAFPFGAQATHSLGTVTVTGEQPSSLPTSIPTTVESMTREQIERAVNATDSEDALKYLPSLLVRKRYVGDYNHAVLSTRASGTGNSARSMVFADGILLSNLLGNGASFAPRWMMVTPEEIERVDVLYGPFSAAYPGNSVGAVVDYVTRMPSKFEAHAKILGSGQDFRLYGTDGRFGAGQASVSFGDRNGAWAWWLHAARSASDGHPQGYVTRAPSQGTPGAAGAVPVQGAEPGVNRSSQPNWVLGTTTQYETRQDLLKAKLAWDVSPRVRAAYTFGSWRNESKGRPATYLRDPAGAPVFAGPVSIDGRTYALGAGDFVSSDERLEHRMHGLSIRSRTNGIFDWSLAASRYDYHADTLRAPTTALPAAAAGGAGRIVSLGGSGWTALSARGAWRTGTHVFEAGVQRDAYRLRSAENATVQWQSGAAGARNNAFQGDVTLLGLWAQDDWAFADRWKAVTGLRLEQWEAFNGATSSASARALHPDRRNAYASPKFALAHQWSDAWQLKGSIGRAFRMPTVSELYQGGLNASGGLVNNDPDLRPEHSWTAELSAEGELRASEILRFTAFFERTKDALYSQLNPGNVNTVQNVDAIRTRGLEASWQGRDAGIAGLDLSASLTWTQSLITRNDAFAASVGKWQPRIPRWRGTMLATWRADERWSVSAAARYSGKQFSTLDNSDPNGFAFQGASRYFVVDVRARAKVAGNLTAAIGIDNLNNHAYWNFHPYPRRTLVAELKADL